MEKTFCSSLARLQRIPQSVFIVSMFFFQLFSLISADPPTDFGTVKWMRGTSANALFTLLNHVKSAGAPILYPHGEGMTDHGLVQYSGEDGVGVQLDGVNYHGISAFVMSYHPAEMMYLEAARYAAEKAGSANDVIKNRMFCHGNFDQVAQNVIREMNASSHDLFKLFDLQRTVLRLRQWDDENFKKIVVKNPIRVASDFELLNVIKDMRAFKQIFSLKDSELQLSVEDRAALKGHADNLEALPFSSEPTPTELATVTEIERIVRGTYARLQKLPNFPKIDPLVVKRVSTWVAEGLVNRVDIASSEMSWAKNLGKELSDDDVLLNHFFKKTFYHGNGHKFLTHSLYRLFFKKSTPIREIALVLRVVLGGSGLLADGAFANVRDGFNISYFDDIDKRIVHLRKVFIGILRDIDPSRNVNIELTDADKKIMCGVHVPLVMAGTTNITPVGEDMAQAATFPALTFGKNVDVVVSPRAEHCKFVLDWIKDQGLVDSVAVFTTKMTNGEDAFDEILKIDWRTNKEEFVAQMNFVKCEDVVSGDTPRHLRER